MPEATTADGLARFNLLGSLAHHDGIAGQGFSFVRDLVSVGFGLALLVGAKFWTPLFFKFRNLGHAADERDPS